MTYDEVLRKISKRNEKKRNTKVIRDFFAEVMRGAWRDGRFVLPKVFSLTVKTHKARWIQNPITKEPMHLSAVKTMKARVAKEWRTR